MLFWPPDGYCPMSCQWETMTVKFPGLLWFPGEVVEVAEDATGLRTNVKTVGCVGVKE